MCPIFFGILKTEFKMKKKEILLVIILFFSLNVKALTKDSLIFGKKNYVLIGIYETGFFGYTANISYERIFIAKTNFKLGSKIGMISNGPLIKGLETGTSLFIGNKRHFFETRLNLEFVSLRGDFKTPLGRKGIYYPPILSLSFYPTLGYRYFSKKSFTFQLHFIPIITYTNSEIGNQYNNLGFSFGFGF